MNTQIGRAGLPTKKQISAWMKQNFPGITTSYSGRNRTLFITGRGCKDAELAFLKTFPQMTGIIKTESQETRPVPTTRTYYFRANGEFVFNDNASNIVFTCVARDNRNARRKFGNHVTSLSTKTH